MIGYDIQRMEIPTFSTKDDAQQPLNILYTNTNANMNNINLIRLNNDDIPSLYSINNNNNINKNNKIYKTNQKQLSTTPSINSNKVSSITNAEQRNCIDKSTSLQLTKILVYPNTNGITTSTIYKDDTSTNTYNKYDTYTPIESSNNRISCNTITPVNKQKHFFVYNNHDDPTTAITKNNTIDRRYTVNDNGINIIGTTFSQYIDNNDDVFKPTALYPSSVVGKQPITLYSTKPSSSVTNDYSISKETSYSHRSLSNISNDAISISPFVQSAFNTTNSTTNTTTSMQKLKRKRLFRANIINNNLPKEKISQLVTSVYSKYNFNDRTVMIPSGMYLRKEYIYQLGNLLSSTDTAANVTSTSIDNNNNDNNNDKYNDKNNDKNKNCDNNNYDNIIYEESKISINKIEESITPCTTRHDTYRYTKNMLNQISFLNPDVEKHFMNDSIKQLRSIFCIVLYSILLCNILNCIVSNIILHIQYKDFEQKLYIELIIYIIIIILTFGYLFIIYRNTIDNKNIPVYKYLFYILQPSNFWNDISTPLSLTCNNNSILSAPSPEETKNLSTYTFEVCTILYFIITSILFLIMSKSSITSSTVIMLYIIIQILSNINILSTIFVSLILVISLTCNDYIKGFSINNDICKLETNICNNTNSYTMYIRVSHIICSFIVLSFVLVFKIGFLNYIRILYLDRQLYKEKQLQTNAILLNLIPPRVLDQLIKSSIHPSSYKTSRYAICADKFIECSVLFCEISNFKQLTKNVLSYDLISLLNDLFICFDHLTERYKVYKVETVGEVYMVASNVPDNVKNHAFHLCALALELQAAASLEFVCDENNIISRPETRIGIHTGDVVAGAIGSKLPRYRLFGDTVNTASRMQSTALSNTIQISKALYAQIISMQRFYIIPRGLIHIKGKGKFYTYILLSTLYPQESPRFSYDENNSIIPLTPPLDEVTPSWVIANTLAADVKSIDSAADVTTTTNTVQQDIVSRQSISYISTTNNSSVVEQVVYDQIDITEDDSGLVDTTDLLSTMEKGEANLKKYLQMFHIQQEKDMQLYGNSADIINTNPPLIKKSINTEQYKTQKQKEYQKYDFQQQEQLYKLNCNTIQSTTQPMTLTTVLKMAQDNTQRDTTHTHTSPQSLFKNIQHKDCTISPTLENFGTPQKLS